MTLPIGYTVLEKSEIKTWLKDRNKTVSGYCNEHDKPGQHEGQRPKNYRGRPLKTCPNLDKCPCQCHYQVEKMFKLTGMERQDMSNPEYVPEHSEFVMPIVPDPVTGTVALVSGDPLDPSALEDAYTPPPVATQTPLAQRRTPLGYAGRGALEAQVWDCSRTLIKEGVEVTTLVASTWIESKYKVPPPSRGAIQAVWERWVKLEYAELGKKPVRFVRFTQDDTWERLERIKSSGKTKKKADLMAAKRGTLRRA